MKDAELNRKIAEACGYRFLTWKDPNGVIIHQGWYHEEETHLLDDPPDYCNDLNACHEMERALDRDEFIKYSIEVSEQCRHEDKTGALLCEIINATSRQRAEAFLKTKGIA